MDKFTSGSLAVRLLSPELPVLAARPHVAERAAAWFLANFPGETVYAVKANTSPVLLRGLVDAGIRQFDVASLDELELVSQIPGAVFHIMHPVKSRELISRAYHDYGARCFALNSTDELEKILRETGGAKDLSLFVRLSYEGMRARVPLERKFGVAGDDAIALLRATRQCADELGVTFHVGSQCVNPEAFAIAMDATGRLIARAGVVVDAVDVGGGFPSIYPGETVPALDAYMQVIAQAAEGLVMTRNGRLLCEPGRALVAEAESVYLRVEARRGNELFVNDGSFGTLYDAAHLGMAYPARLLSDDGRAGDSLAAFALWGPTCDSADFMPGPFMLPETVREGDYIEIGNIGAYGRVMATRFNGYGAFREIVVTDEPMLSLFPHEEIAAQRSATVRRAAS